MSSLFQKYFTFSPKEQIKVQYVLIGLIIFVVPNLIFNVIFPFLGRTAQVRYYPFGNYSAIFLLAFTAYAIVKRELFGIKVVLTALLVGLIAVLILLDIFFLTEDPLAQLFKGLLLIIFLYFGYLLVQSVVREIQYRERLQRAYKELKKLDTAKSEFMSIASHQLRTPLTAIKGYISMILEGSYGQLLEKTRRPMEGVYKSNERLIKLVNDLLSVSRIEAGKIRMKLEKASLEELIESVIEELENEATRKKIYLEWKKPEKVLPKILIDKSKIRAIILNIIDNAIRYTSKGGVTIKAKVSDKIVQISVSDTGTGISKEELSKLFESFSRGVAGSRLYTEGVGLGLYIGRKFAEMHEGKIWAKSKGSGKGSTFYLELPIK